jgi:predicted nucleic acid-binding protein
MIILDTNVLSEEMKPAPVEAVHNWFSRQTSANLYTTAICEAEIRSGVAILADGRRKDALMSAANSVFALFAGRILPFDSAAAAAYAEIVAERRAIGRAINDFDAQIAAVARSRGMALATRNVADFEAAGIDVIDPWSAGA